MKNNLNKLSAVITVTETDRKFLKRCLVNLEKSAYRAHINIEIIIILNGIKIINPNYLKSDYKLLEESSNIGFGRAINHGMNIARYEWCIILAPDTLTKKNTLTNLRKNTINIKTAIIVPKILTKNGLDYNHMPIPTLKNIFLEQSYLYKLPLTIFKLPNSDIRDYKYSHEIKAVSSTYWIINRKYFFEVGGFDSRYFLYYDDIDLCKRFTLNNLKIYYDSSSSVMHFIHGSQNGQTNVSLYIEGMYLYLTKYYNKMCVFVCFILVISGSMCRIIYWILIRSQLSRIKIKYYSRILYNSYIKLVKLFIYESLPEYHH